MSKRTQRGPKGPKQSTKAHNGPKGLKAQSGSKLLNRPKVTKIIQHSSKWPKMTKKFGLQYIPENSVSNIFFGNCRCRCLCYHSTYIDWLLCDGCNTFDSHLAISENFIFFVFSSKKYLQFSMSILIQYKHNTIKRRNKVNKYYCVIQTNLNCRADTRILSWLQRNIAKDVQCDLKETRF